MSKVDKIYKHLKAIDIENEFVNKVSVLNANAFQMQLYDLSIETHPLRIYHSENVKIFLLNDLPKHTSKS